MTIDQITPVEAVFNLAPRCITSFPISIHREAHKISRGALDARTHLQHFDSYKEFRSHSAGPYGNFFAICWPGSNVSRTKLAAEMIETLWIYDDVAESLPHSSALQTHANLRNCLTGEREKTSQDVVVQLFGSFKSRLTRMDSKGAPALIDALRSYLDTYDSQDGPPPTLREYIEFRILNVGFGIMDIFMQWTMGIRLDKTEVVMSRNFYLSAGRVMALTNDLYSWEVERKESADRSWNAVPILMKQHIMEEKDAVAVLKGLVVYYEQETRRLGIEVRENSKQSRKMSRYVDAMELMLGGNCFWSSTCPRYMPA
ncbi:terpenoid synthase [Xylariaceae sp. AK1471]|nr:terpenoid synthase [Xylariaceae sp. AK1471]